MPELPKEISQTPCVVFIKGEGIGPEISEACMKVLNQLVPEMKFIVAEAGNGLLPQATIDLIKQHKVCIKGPLTTPIASGHPSINVQLRKMFDLYANVRPAYTLAPGLSRYDGIDIITVRENTEGAYVQEGQWTSDDGTHAESRIVATREGSERIAEYAFKLALKEKRSLVTVLHKANILKSTSGLFLKVCREVAAKYPTIKFREMIIDNACMQLVSRPDQFDVILTTNLFGDIVSDLCAALVGGLGVVCGSNIGDEFAIFEAVHGSAPDIAGKGIANPCAMLMACVAMLRHLSFYFQANKLEYGIKNVIKRGDVRCLTPDLRGTGSTTTICNAILAEIDDTTSATPKHCHFETDE